MSRPGDRLPDDSASPPEQRSSSQGAPLVIVSEQGRHSQASRRIVRAQAARASAAQSRVTRARNRDQRQGAPRDGPGVSPSTGIYHASPSPLPEHAFQHVPYIAPGHPQEHPATKPLTRWVVALLGLSADSSGNINLAFQSVPPPRHDFGTLQLPLALPRGFVGLQQAVDVPKHTLTLLSRTACVDFASQGLEQRLNHLLQDLIIDSPGPPGRADTLSSHPIQEYLRIACICLTIYQGQHASGQGFGRDGRYQDGLRAAWAEATALNLHALAEPKLAQISLWIIFSISVTAGAEVDFFLNPVRGLLNDLQFVYWEQVRKSLLDFIFPVSVLDEPFRQFFFRITSNNPRVR